MMLNKYKIVAIFFTIFIGYYQLSFSDNLNIVEPKNLSEVLTNFIKYDDDAYNYEFLEKSNSNDLDILVYLLTAQKWPINKTDSMTQTIWKHKLIIYIPKSNIKFNKILLYVNAGYNNKDGKEELTKEKVNFAEIAKQTQLPVIELRNNPNQFLLIDEKLQKEDQILASTYLKVMDNPYKNAYLAGHLPMAKSVIKAIDASYDIFLKKYDIKIQEFILAGASKRGWAIWLAALEDSRVSAIIPIVIDILNVPETISHICQSYKDGCPEALRDYKNAGVIDKIHSKNFKQLMKIEDPFSYLSPEYDKKYQSRLSIPKYIINSSGDDFFVPDSSKFYFNKLPGNQNYIRYLPNSMHYLSGNPISDALGNQKKVDDAISTFYKFQAKNIILPDIKWEFKQNSINITSSIKPEKVLLWYSINNNSRDFRCITSYSYMNLVLKKILSFFTNNLCDNKFKFKNINFHCNNISECLINIDIPNNKWTAAFAELHYNIDGNRFIVTTEVKI
ncbi:PhoPQ-activated protein PqaA family protein [Candidatus Aquarickettsia rohweri]|nr:PhoPQ-activated protein PqaA family protein [Candidatus Aquarickettsia rohweri]